MFTNISLAYSEQGYGPRPHTGWLADFPKKVYAFAPLRVTQQLSVLGLGKGKRRKEGLICSSWENRAQFSLLCNLTNFFISIKYVRAYYRQVIIHYFSKTNA